jgi:hypothetical protein
MSRQDNEFSFDWTGPEPAGTRAAESAPPADEEAVTREITVTATWRSTHVVTVPADFTDTGMLSDFPAGALEEMDAHTAELVDWTVR